MSKISTEKLESLINNQADRDVIEFYLCFCARDSVEGMLGKISVAIKKLLKKISIYIYVKNPTLHKVLSKTGFRRLYHMVRGN